MNIWGIVPVKPLNRAKSRLAPVLAPDARETLAMGMLRHITQTLIDAPAIAGVLVISRDPKVLALAREFRDVQTVLESGAPELNEALSRATRVVAAWGAEGALILPADIPLVTSADIEAILHLGRFRPAVVVAPDRAEDGTNALFIRPPELIAPTFGPASFRRHISAAVAASVAASVYRSARVELDVDTPDDLYLYYEMAREMGLPALGNLVGQPPLED